MARTLSEPVLRRAAAVVRHGGVIAYPTEFCFGLGCDPGNIPAIRRILDIKQRRREEGLLLIAAGIDQLLPWVDLGGAGIRDRLKASWPGPVTWLVPAGLRASSWLTGDHDTLGVRVTAHPQAASLCRHIGMPLVSTSANRTGQAELRDQWSVRANLPGVDYVVPGEVGSLGAPTSIRHALTGSVIRPGFGPDGD